MLSRDQVEALIVLRAFARGASFLVFYFAACLGGAALLGLEPKKGLLGLFVLPLFVWAWASWKLRGGRIL